MSFGSITSSQLLLGLGEDDAGHDFHVMAWFREPILFGGSPFNPCKLADSISRQKTTPPPFLNLFTILDVFSVK